MLLGTSQYVGYFLPGEGGRGGVENRPSLKSLPSYQKRSFLNPQRNILPQREIHTLWLTILYDSRIFLQQTPCNHDMIHCCLKYLLLPPPLTPRPPPKIDISDSIFSNQRAQRPSYHKLQDLVVKRGIIIKKWEVERSCNL